MKKATTIDVAASSLSPDIAAAFAADNFCNPSGLLAFSPDRSGHFRAKLNHK